jgi:MoaA/NifB/PqqE/SkfB family radical SAM enzyme
VAPPTFEDSPEYGAHRQETRPWPDVVQLEITSVCNLRCVMCPVTCETRDRSEGERVLSVADLEPLRELFENAYEVELTGFGEIFTHPDLLGVLRFLRGCGCTINATTNGTRMDAQRVRSIVGEGLIDLLCISLDAAKPETLARVRVGADLEQIVANARGLVAIRNEMAASLPRLHHSFITMERNLAELPDFVRLAHAIGAEAVIVQGLQESAETAAENTARDAAREATVYREAKRVAESLGVAMEFWYQGTREEDAVAADGRTLTKYQVTARPGGAALVKDCPFPWDRVFIKSNLDVQVCATVWETLVMGNLRRQTFAEVWNGDAYRTVRDRMRGTSPPGECADCMTKHWRVALPREGLADAIDFGDLYAAQLGLGFYPVERDARGRGHRWLRRRATFFLGRADRPVLELDLHFHPDVPPLAARVLVNGRDVGRVTSRTHWNSPARIAVPPASGDFLRVDLVFDREWRPIDHGLPGGYRPITALAYGARLAALDVGTDVVAGGRGDAQFVEGWYAPEPHFGKPARWSTAEATVVLPGGPEAALELNTLNLPDLGGRTVRVTIDGAPAKGFTTDATPGPRRARIAVPRSDAAWRVVRLVVDPPWTPSADGVSRDHRELGLLLRSVGLARPSVLTRLCGKR